MHILIDGLAARVGGGRTRLLGTIEALTHVSPRHRYSILLSPRYQQSLIASLPLDLSVIEIDIEGSSLVRRSFFQNVELPRIADRIEADAIFACGEGAYCRSPRPLVILSGNLALFSNQTLNGPGGSVYRLTRRPFLKRAFHVAARVAFVSHTMRTIAVQQMNIPAEKAIVAQHGVDSRFFSRQVEPAEPYYLAVSSISSHKGYEDLLTAWALSKNASRLLIAGTVLDRSTFSRLASMCRGSSLESTVTFLGEVPYGKMPDLYRGARALVFPSRLESFGLPLLEAMACGVPVITTELPICREICGDAALFIPAGDPSALAIALERMDRDQALRRELSARGRERASLFTWENGARVLAAAFEEVCHAPSA